MPILARPQCNGIEFLCSKCFCQTHTAHHTQISSKAAGNPGFLFQITSPQGAKNSWVVATLEHPQHPLLFIPNHSRSSLALLTQNSQIYFSKPTSMFLLSPIHPSPPTISARSRLNPVSQHVLPTRPVTAQMGPGSKSKPSAHQPLLGSLPGSASCSLIARKPRTAFSQPHPLPLITFPSKYLYPGIMPAPPT